MVPKQLDSPKSCGSVTAWGLFLGSLGCYLFIRLGDSTPASCCRPLGLAALLSMLVGGEIRYPSGRGRLILPLFV